MEQLLAHSRVCVGGTQQIFKKKTKKKLLHSSSVDSVNFQDFSKSFIDFLNFLQS